MPEQGGLRGPGHAAPTSLNSQHPPIRIIVLVKLHAVLRREIVYRYSKANNATCEQDKWKQEDLCHRCVIAVLCPQQQPLPQGWLQI